MQTFYKWHKHAAYSIHLLLGVVMHTHCVQATDPLHSNQSKHIDEK